MDNENKMMMETNTEEETIDLLELANMLLHRAWALIFCMIICALLTGIGTALLITPQYKATSMIYIYNKTTSITSLADLQIGSQLAVDFQIVATTREVVDNVIERLELDATYEGFLKTISISNPTGSHMLKIVATNPDPELAADISNAMADELRARIADVMNTDEPSVVDRAYVPTKPASPSIKRNAAIGGIGGAALLAVVMIVFYLMDDTIKSGDDVKKYLNLNVLAEIPVERGQKKKKAS